jgi:hypothetical protein
MIAGQHFRIFFRCNARINDYRPKRKNPVGQIFREAAVTVNTSKSPSGDSYRRMKSRRVPVGQLLQRPAKSAELFT